MIRTVRRAAAALCLALITLLFLDFTGTLHPWFGWLAKIQFLPALLAVNVAIIGALIVATLLLGRIYCSVLCPLGVFQDLVSRLGGKWKKNRFRFAPARKVLRYGILAVFVVALIAGVNSIVTLLAPYSTYGRMVSTLLGPIYLWGNNLLAALAERFDSYAFYRVDVWMKSAIATAVSLATLVVISLLAFRNGRTWCNAICPVGTVLGTLARFSLLKPRIAADRCTSCGLCARNCKASCIDHRSKQIDYSRCVVCLNCTKECRRGAIEYSPARRTKRPEAIENPPGAADTSRRQFLSASILATVVTAGRAHASKVDGGLAVLRPKVASRRSTPIVPAGARGLQHLSKHCTACQLCVSACPNQVLRPSSEVGSLMQPELSFEHGYCRPECTRCSEVCPTGAIHRVDPAEKSAVQIGHAVWVRERCVINTDGVKCTICSRRCPANAVHLIQQDPDDPGSPSFPVVDTERCIGCGACEHLCPARPSSAIYVEGHEVHRVV